MIERAMAPLQGSRDVVAIASSERPCDGQSLLFARPFLPSELLAGICSPARLLTTRAGGQF